MAKENNKRKLSDSEYRFLCAEIHRKYGRKLGLAFWESCDLADSIACGEVTKEKLFEFVSETLEEN